MKGIWLVITEKSSGRVNGSGWLGVAARDLLEGGILFMV